MNDVNNVILDFINASINNGVAQKDGNANQANKFYRVIEKRTKWLIDHNELCNPFIMVILSDIQQPTTPACLLINHHSCPEAIKNPYVN